MHPERFSPCCGANIKEQGRFYVLVEDALTPALWASPVARLGFDYSGDGLYVSGWRLVDANGEEIAPDTAQEVFPAASNPTQPVTDGPKFVAFGGGWYLNVILPNSNRGPRSRPAELRDAGDMDRMFIPTGSTSRRSSPHPS